MSSAVCCGTRTDSTCCPLKAISIRTRSVSAISDELCQNTTSCLRMDEPDLEAEHALPRHLVDQLDTGLLQAGDLCSHIRRGEGDVMHARTALGEEPADRSVRTERGEQLDPRRADA